MPQSTVKKCSKLNIEDTREIRIQSYIVHTYIIIEVTICSNLPSNQKEDFPVLACHRHKWNTVSFSISLWQLEYTPCICYQKLYERCLYEQTNQDARAQSIKGSSSKANRTENERKKLESKNIKKIDRDSCITIKRFLLQQEGDISIANAIGGGSTPVAHRWNGRGSHRRDWVDHFASIFVESFENREKCLDYALSHRESESTGECFLSRGHREKREEREREWRMCMEKVLHVK